MIIESQQNRIQRNTKQIAPSVSQCCSSHRFSSFSHVAEGWEHSVWEADNKYIIRFPAHSESSIDLANEVNILRYISSEFPVELPNYNIFGTLSGTEKLAFAGYKKIMGRSLFDVWPDFPSDSVAVAYGQFLKFLYDLPLSQPKLLGVGYCKKNVLTQMNY